MAGSGRRSGEPPPDLRELARRAVAAQAARDQRALDASTAHTSGAYQRFRALLGPDQLSLVDDTHPLVAACWGRRSGKTVTFIAKDLKVRQKRANARSCYFAPSDDQGVDILWEEIREYNKRLDLGYVERWSEREWRRGGGRIEVLGFNAKKDVDRARGRYYDLVRIDEAQLAPDWFTAVAEAAIFPTTLDYLGQIEATGTPTRVAAGFFFDVCHDSSGKWSNDHHSTAARNPFFIRQGRDPLAEARERYHLTETSLTYRCEWLAIWDVDPDALVYYIPDGAVRAAPPGTRWYGHVLGLDLGWKDHDAIGAMGIEELRQWSHLRHMETAGQQTNHQLFRRLLVLAEYFPGPRPLEGGPPKPIVTYDPAGHATRKTIETYRSDAPGIIWLEADKREKVEAISWLNNDLREGSTFVEPRCSMVKEARRLQWKRPGKVAEDADHSDQGDAWLYSWRRARTYLRKLPKKVSAGPLDPFDEMQKQLEEHPGDGRTGYFADRLRGLS